MAGVVRRMVEEHGADGIKLDGLGDVEGHLIPFPERAGHLPRRWALTPVMDVYRLVGETLRQARPEAFLESGWVNPAPAQALAHTFRYGDEWDVFDRVYPFTGLAQHFTCRRAALAAGAAPPRGGRLRGPQPAPRRPVAGRRAGPGGPGEPGQRPDLPQAGGSGLPAGPAGAPPPLRRDHPHGARALRPAPHLAATPWGAPSPPCSTRARRRGRRRSTCGPPGSPGPRRGGPGLRRERRSLLPGRRAQRAEVPGRRCGCSCCAARLAWSGRPAVPTIRRSGAGRGGDPTGAPARPAYRPWPAAPLPPWGPAGRRAAGRPPLPALPGDGAGTAPAEGGPAEDAGGPGEGYAYDAATGHLAVRYAHAGLAPPGASGERHPERTLELRP